MSGIPSSETGQFFVCVIARVTYPSVERLEPEGYLA